MVFIKGQIAWNKGKIKEDFPQLGNGGSFKKGHRAWHAGTKGLFGSHHTQKHSPVSRIKMSESRKRWFQNGGKVWNAKGGKPKCNDCGKQLSAYGAKRCHVCAMKHMPKSFFRKCLRPRGMSSLEIRLNNIIKENNLPYKFVGNGKFMIEKKCPDFINTNGEKIAVEVFYKRHKEEFRGGVNNWMKNRTKIFAKYGWKIIFLEASYFANNSSVVDVLGGGGK